LFRAGLNEFGPSPPTYSIACMLVPGLRSKKQPSLDDLAAAFKMIRDQYQIIKLQGNTIRRQEQLLVTVLLTYPRLEELRVN
jgi:hypothetical protein